MSGNKRLIISSHMDNLLKLPVVSSVNDVKGISQLYDKTEIHIRSLRMLNSIHRMQIWRTARSSPGTSSIKARLVGLECFVLTGKSCFVVDLVYFLSPSIKVFVFVNTTRTKRDLPQ